MASACGGARDARGSEVELTVADDGVGIPKERIPSLFVPFGSRKPGGEPAWGCTSCAVWWRKCTAARSTSRARSERGRR